MQGTVVGADDGHVTAIVLRVVFGFNIEAVEELQRHEEQGSNSMHEAVSAGRHAGGARRLSHGLNQPLLFIVGNSAATVLGIIPPIHELIIMGGRLLLASLIYEITTNDALDSETNRNKKKKKEDPE